MLAFFHFGNECEVNAVAHAMLAMLCCNPALLSCDPSKYEYMQRNVNRGAPVT